MQSSGPHRPTRDHLVPRKYRHLHRGNHLLIVCSRCNADKGEMSLRQFARALWACGDKRAILVEMVIQKHPRFAGSDVNLHPMVEPVHALIDGALRVRFQCNGCGILKRSMWAAWKHGSHGGCFSALQKVRIECVAAQQMESA